jgi:hypothetical protein
MERVEEKNRIVDWLGFWGGRLIGDSHVGRASA